MTGDGSWDADLIYILLKEGASHNEKQVNAILGRFNEDTAGLRRDLIDFGFLQRQADGGEYWRSQPK